MRVDLRRGGDSIPRRAVVNVTEFVEFEAPHTGRLLVLGEITLQRERFAATRASERLFGRVRLNMRAQVGFVGERFAAFRTVERFLPGVRAHVALQQPRSAEPLAAKRADAALAMRAHVHAVGGHGDVDLVAMRALARLAVRRVAMRLLVT